MLGLTDLKISLYTTTKGGFGGTALSLDFLSGALDSRITFSRGTNATLIDSTGKLTYAPNNLVVRSEEFNSGANWITISTAVTANATTAPNGTQTADKLYPTVSAGRLYQDATTVGASVFSFYAKAAEMSVVNIRNPANGPSAIAYLDLNTGVISGASAASASAVSVGNGWWRFSIIFATAITNVALAPCDAAGSTVSTVSGANGIFVWGAQLEAVTYQTTPGTYNATTSAAYYGPRFDYDPVTLAPKGLLIEEARTNLLLYSEQFDNAAWTKTNATVTANATVSPDGTTNADKLIPSTSLSQHRIDFTTSAAAGTYAFSTYIKAAGYNFAWFRIGLNGGWVDLTNGSVSGVTGGYTMTSTAAGNGWYRLVLVGAAALNDTVRINAAQVNLTSDFTGDGTSGIYIYGAQLEAGSFATSYIPTVASTVTRNADVATMTGTNFSTWFNQTEGTFVADVLDNAAGVNVLVASDGTTSNQLIMTSSTLNIFSVFTGGAFQAMLGVTPPAPYKSTGAYKVNDFAAAANGGTVSTDTSGTLATYSRLSIGANAVSNAAFLNGHIRTIAYFNTRLPNAQLQTLTAPSLATTLSLDFTSGSYNVGF